MLKPDLLSKWSIVKCLLGAFQPNSLIYLQLMLSGHVIQFRTFDLVRRWKQRNLNCVGYTDLVNNLH